MTKCPECGSKDEVDKQRCDGQLFCVKCGYVYTVNTNFAPELTFGEKESMGVTKVGVLGGKPLKAGRNASFAKKHAVSALRDKQPKRPSMVLKRATDIIRGVGEKVMLERETALLKSVERLLKAVDRNSNAKRTSKRSKHALLLPKDLSVTAGALLVLAVENDNWLRGRI